MNLMPSRATPLSSSLLDQGGGVGLPGHCHIHIYNAPWSLIDVAPHPPSCLFQKTLFAYGI